MQIGLRRPGRVKGSLSTPPGWTLGEPLRCATQKNPARKTYHDLSTPIQIQEMVNWKWWIGRGWGWNLQAEVLITISASFKYLITSMFNWFYVPNIYISSVTELFTIILKSLPPLLWYNGAFCAYYLLAVKKKNG